MRLYHYLEAKFALDDIRRRRLKASKIDETNDPYEWRSVVSDYVPSQTALEGARLKGSEDHSLTYFSKSWNNTLMWSHYGDKHKGICLGFDVPSKLLREVTYFDAVETIGDLHNLPQAERLRIMNKLYDAKYKGWCYEQEFRANGRREEKGEETGQYFVPFDEKLVLREVIAGARFPLSSRPVREALSGYRADVSVVKLRAEPKHFELIVGENGFWKPS